ncbi:winged helix-turn-helix domain-containing protein [Erwinia typographi]|uniref:winged helix-turn-helix domain-containing protein n=1 Tax=Erwinia typographi TaxID=371042 RepID=UPI00068DB3D8|nr:winged helix-turn-helix domain-containing protein [Erwinia typographi]
MDVKCDKIYRLNNAVIFVPNKNTLISCADNSQHVLYSTASRCLVLLIENIGEIVNHRQFYESGWEAQGKEVTPNTLYQTISELRKQLKKSGVGNNIIKTLPRHGWFIDPATLSVEDYIAEENADNFYADKEVLNVNKGRLTTLLPRIGKLKAFAVSLVLIL